MALIGKILLWLACVVGTGVAIMVLLVFALYLATGGGSRWEE